MNKVASHINEMQKIHEEFGAVFDQLITEQSSEKKDVGLDKCSLFVLSKRKKKSLWDDDVDIFTQLPGGWFIDGRFAAAQHSDMDQPTYFSGKMEERTTDGNIWYASDDIQFNQSILFSYIVSALKVLENGTVLK